MSNSVWPHRGHEAPPSLGFSRQEHWSGLPFPSPMHESEKWKWSRSVLSDSLSTPWTAAYQVSPSMGFSRQEDWSGVPLPSPLHIWGCWYFSGQSWFQLVIHPAWHFTWCTLLIRKINRVTIYSLVLLLSQFWTCCSMSNSSCCFLTCIQVSHETGKMFWYSHLFQNFPQFAVIHTVKALE